jgi:hypothetical protein
MEPRIPHLVSTLIHQLNNNYHIGEIEIDDTIEGIHVRVTRSQPYPAGGITYIPMSPGTSKPDWDRPYVFTCESNHKNQQTGG